MHMPLEIALAFLFGLSLGVLAGLVPGLHPNTILVILVSIFRFSESYASYPLLTFVVSMAVCNTIVNFIPGIFFGAPEPDNCLSVLPGHRFLMLGRGYEALFLTVVGGVVTIMLTVLSFPFLLWFIPFIYTSIYAYMHWLLIAVLALLVYHEKGRKRYASLLIFFVSGTLGFMLLSVLSSEEVLFPALTGLFGIPLIMVSIMQGASIPAQTVKVKPEYRWVKGGVGGWLAGLFVGILPGIGSAQAGVLASRLLKGNERDFLVALGGINTSNIIFTFVALHATGKTRSGAAWALSEFLGKITLNEVYFILLIAALSCFIASFITLKLGMGLIRVSGKVNYKKINTAVFLLIVCLVLLFSGIRGIVIMAACVLVGLACTYMGVKKMYLIGFLMLPTILYFSGASAHVLLFLGL